MLWEDCHRGDAARVSTTLLQLAPLFSSDALHALEELASPKEACAPAARKLLCECFNVAMECGHRDVVRAFMESGIPPGVLAYTVPHEGGEEERLEHCMVCAARYECVGVLRWLHNGAAAEGVPAHVYCGALTAAVLRQCVTAAQYLLSLQVVQDHLHGWVEPFRGAFCTYRPSRAAPVHVEGCGSIPDALLAVKALCAAPTTHPRRWDLVLRHCSVHLATYDPCALHYLVRAALHDGLQLAAALALQDILLRVPASQGSALMLCTVLNAAAVQALAQVPAPMWGTLMTELRAGRKKDAFRARALLQYAPHLCACSMMQEDLALVLTREWVHCHMQRCVDALVAPGVATVRALVNMGKALAHVCILECPSFPMQHFFTVWKECVRRADFTVGMAVGLADRALCAAVDLYCAGHAGSPLHAHGARHRAGCTGLPLSRTRVEALHSVLALRHPLCPGKPCPSPSTVYYLVGAAVMGHVPCGAAFMVQQLQQHGVYTHSAATARTVLNIECVGKPHGALLTAMLKGMTADEVHCMLCIEEEAAAAAHAAVPAGEGDVHGVLRRNQQRVLVCAALLECDAFVMDKAAICLCRDVNAELYARACDAWFERRGRHRQRVLQSRVQRRRTRALCSA